MPPGLEPEMRSSSFQTLAQTPRSGALDYHQVGSRGLNGLIKRVRGKRHKSFGRFWMRLWHFQPQKDSMQVVLGAVPSGKGRMGLGTADVAVYLRDFPGLAPAPIQQWREAGALFSCSLHLRYLIRGARTTPPTPLQAHLRLRSAGPAGLRASTTYTSLSLSLPTGPSSVSPPTSHLIAAQSRRHWFQRLSGKLVAHIVAQVRHCS